MIFTIGLVLFLIGLAGAANRGGIGEPPMWEAASGCLGFVLMVLSLCILTWRSLP